MILNDWTRFPPAARGGVLSIGNFDGVHLGHARMLTRGRAAAAAAGVPLTIMTFDPHPNALLKPQAVRPPLSDPGQRVELLQRFSPDVLLVIPTTREFLAVTPEAFLTEVVQRAIGAAHIVEGPSFTFGRGARGTVDLLQQAGPTHGFVTTIVPTEEVALSDLTLAGVSSSLIRWLLEHGRVADAAKCLGRPYGLRGTVVEGQKRGRGIGFPTANLATKQLVPAAGVYAGRAVTVAGTYRAAISVGTNPTFRGTVTTVEAYLLDFDGDLYGQGMELEFHRWIREMIPFGGVPQLVNQMNRDVALTRETIALKGNAG
jgi:riboflavin kinase / FMN adenylyltransferase